MCIRFCCVSVRHELLRLTPTVQSITEHHVTLLEDAAEAAYKGCLRIGDPVSQIVALTMDILTAGPQRCPQRPTTFVPLLWDYAGQSMLQRHG